MATVAIGSTARMVTDAGRARRTEALPKASLFGSVLEKRTEEGDKALEELDPSKIKLPKTPTGKGPGQKFSLPENVRKQLPGAAVVERSRREYEEQLSLLNRHSADLKKSEQEILYNFSRGGEPVSSRRDPGTARSQWFTENDLKGSKEINIVGLNEKQSFNRDKYGDRPPVHNYSLIGDILRPGMDFPRRERTEVQLRNQGYGKGDLRGILVASDGMPLQRKETPKPVSARSPQKAVIDVPPNIKHQVGTRVCDKLLSDRGVVEKTIREQEESKERSLRKSKPFTVPKFTKEMSPDYEMLSNAMRMNVVPGYTMNHKTTTTKTAFNDQVFLFRYQDPDKYRCQKDELSKWRECIFLQKLLAKGWGDVLANVPKFERNWGDASRERTKTAPVPTTRTKRPQTKVKPKTAPKTGEKKAEPFEDFKFETPPTTPPLEKVQNLGKRRDSEFWNFYEKSV